MKRAVPLAVLSAFLGLAPTFAQTPAPSRLVNLSTRARLAAANPLISGFAIAGTGTRTVLVRAVGPGLAAFGVTDAVAAPRLELRDAAGEILATNSGWAGSTTLATAFAQAGAFPFSAGSADAAALVTLPAGTYTVHVADATGGIALAEVYDLGGASGNARLVNVSTRASVAAGSEVISGFVIEGAESRQFLLRGVGPGLNRLGVNGVLVDPALSLFDSLGRELAANDNWSGTRVAVTATSTSNQAAASLAAAVVGAVSGGTAPGVGAVSPNQTSTAMQVAVASAIVSAAVQGAANAQLATAAETGARVTAASTASGAFALDLLSNDAALVTPLGAGAYTVVVNAKASSAPGLALLEIYELP